MNRLTQALLTRHLSSVHSSNLRISRTHSPAAHAGNQSGVSLLEALVAMLVITFTLAVITPPIFIATATRVSNRRTEQAMQLAQGEIERVRLLMLSGRTYEDINPELPPIAANASKDTVVQVAAPISTCIPPGTGDPIPTTVPCSALQLMPTENARLLMQTFREDGATIANGSVVAFRMGVRVYGAEALDSNGQPVAGLLSAPSGVKFTTGASSRVNRPLVAFYTEMIRGTEGGGLSAMQNGSWD